MTDTTKRRTTRDYATREPAYVTELGEQQRRALDHGRDPESDEPTESEQCAFHSQGGQGRCDYCEDQ